MAGRTITTVAANPKPGYNMSGAKSPAPRFDQETGSQSIQSTLREYVPELQLGRAALLTYETMYRQDAQVRTTLRAAFTPVLSADYYMKPFSPDPADILINEFVNWNLFHGMSTTFLHVLANACKTLYLGAEVQELVWTQKPWVSAQAGANSKNSICLQKMAQRPMNTIIQFLYDQNGGPAGVEHTKYNPSDPQSSPDEVTIPIEKLIIYTWDQQGADLRGLSILRSAYKHWYYKENFYKIDGVQKERHGTGVPLIELPPGFDDEDLTFAQNLARNIRTNERAYILQPPGWVISFARLEGNLVDALESAVHHDLMIARNILVQFINQGASSSSGSGGSRSSGAVMLDLFLSASEYFARLLVDSINHYVIPQLVSYNFNVDKFPTLEFKGIGGEKDKQAEAAALRNLAQAYLLTPTPETEKWIRQEYGIPIANDLDQILKEKAAQAKQIKKTTGVDVTAQADPQATSTDGPGAKPAGGNTGKGTTQG